MSKVTVEGTSSPSTFLGTGQRRTVEHDSFVAKLIAKGYVRVVTPPATEVVTSFVDELREVAAMERKITHPPKRSAAKSEWVEFLEDNRVFFPPNATKNDLIARWENSVGKPVDGE